MARRWLITGGTGFLGSHIVSELAQNEEVFAITRGKHPLEDVRNIEVDVSDLKGFETVFYTVMPTHVLHLAAIGDIATCRAEPDHSYAVNVASTKLLGHLCLENNCRMVYTSTDMIFDGENAPYDEESTGKPINIYGEQKLAAEMMLAAAQHLILRLPLLFGIGLNKKKGGTYELLEKLSMGRTSNLFTDEYRTPLWVNDAAKAIISLAKQDVLGTLHLPGPDRLSRYDLGLILAGAAGLNSSLIIPQKQNDTPIGRERPRDVSLRSKKSLLLDFIPTPLESATEQIAEVFNATCRQ